MTELKALSRLSGIADDMRNIGASSMTPHELFAYWAKEIEKAIKLLKRELKALPTLERGECEDISTVHGIFKCSECFCTVEEDAVDFGLVNYCPDCGMVVKRD